MKTITLTRKQLHELVWSTPLTKISEKYSISIPEIKEACNKLKVPLPNSGYWTRLHLGQNVSSTELSKEIIEHEEISFEERERSEKINGIDAVLQQKINEVEIKHASNFIVPTKLTNPDPIIEKVKYSLQTDSHIHNGIIFLGRGELDIKVSKNSVSRALLFMDTLIKLIKDHGYRVSVTDNGSFIVSDEEQFKFFLREKSNREDSGDRWRGSTYTPSGILYLKIEIGYIHKLEWRDGSEPLENQLSKIIAKLELKVFEVKEQKRKWKIERGKQEKEEKIKREIEDQKKKEESEFKDLLQEAKTWKKIEITKEYINYLEKSMIDSGIMNDKISQKILWARNRLEKFDPLNTSQLLED